MKKIGGFFEKFQGKIAGQIKNLAEISEIIKKNTGIIVEMKDIAISGGIIRLKISSAEKSQIFIKKTKILKEIREKTKGLLVKDVG